MAETAKAILGAGDVRLAVYDPVALAWGALGDKLECDKFEITPDSELKRKTSKSRGAYGQNVATVAIAKPTKIGIDISSASIEALAMQFQGLATTVNQGAGALEDVVVAKLDKWAKLSKRNINSVGFAVKNAAETVSYEKDVDYLVNYATGEIKPLSTGAIEADEELHVEGAALAYNQTVIRGGVQAQVRVRAVWEGINQVDGQYIEVEAWEAVLTASNGFDFLAEDFNAIQLEGELSVPAGKTEPYQVRFQS
jgi:hypothetical protein